MNGIEASRLGDLAAPFSPGEIHWRAQKIVERNGKFSALALAYIDARNVMERLDDVCGPENWQERYEETVKGRIICTLSVCVDGFWVNKSDGAGETDVEGDKGAISDALKRAAVKWGIGRHLYGLGNIWAECEVATDREGTPKKTNQGNFIFKKWTSAGQAELNKALGAAPKPTPKPDPVPEKSKLPAAIQDLLDDIACRDTADSLKGLWEARGVETANGPHGAIIKDAFNKRKKAIELMDGVN